MSLTIPEHYKYDKLPNLSSHQGGIRKDSISVSSQPSGDKVSISNRYKDPDSGRFDNYGERFNPYALVAGDGKSPIIRTSHYNDDGTSWISSITNNISSSWRKRKNHSVFSELPKNEWKNVYLNDPVTETAENQNVVKVRTKFD